MSESQRDATGIGLGTGPLPLPPIIPKKGWFRSNFDATSGRSIINILAVVLSITLLSIFFLAYTTQDKQEPPEFPLQPGSSSDIHTYPNGDSITIPFVSVNNTALAIDFPEGILFPNGDPTNHNNTYVPAESIPIDPVCSTGQFYSESGQCLWEPDRCSSGSSPDKNTGLCSIESESLQPTMCSNGNQNNSMGFCFSPPQCPSDYKYDVPSRLCVPNTWPVDCTSTVGNRMNQEGWYWTIPTGDNTTISDRTNQGTNIVTKSNSIGFVVQWLMPKGNITGYEAGVYYNPVNFYQNVPSDTTEKQYMFFQVDYGIGKLLGNRQGLIMTFEQGGSRQYSFIKLNDVIVTPGSKYWITGVLEPAPLANPPVYIVQVIHETHSWVYRKEIDDINPGTSPVYKFLSFQDQWISTPFASNLTRDEISHPAIVSVENGNKISRGSFLTSATPYSIWASADTNGTYKLLSPHLTTPFPSHLSSQLNTYTDSRDCQGFGVPSTDTVEGSVAIPGDPLKNGTYTSLQNLPHHNVP